MALAFEPTPRSFVAAEGFGPGRASGRPEAKGGASLGGASEPAFVLPDEIAGSAASPTGSADDRRVGDPEAGFSAGLEQLEAQSELLEPAAKARSRSRALEEGEEGASTVPGAAMVASLGLPWLASAPEVLSAAGPPGAVSGVAEPGRGGPLGIPPGPATAPDGPNPAGAAASGAGIPPDGLGLTPSQEISAGDPGLVPDGPAGAPVKAGSSTSDGGSAVPVAEQEPWPPGLGKALAEARDASLGRQAAVERGRPEGRAGAGEPPTGRSVQNPGAPNWFAAALAQTLPTPGRPVRDAETPPTSSPREGTGVGDAKAVTPAAEGAQGPSGPGLRLGTTLRVSKGAGQPAEAGGVESGPEAPAETSLPPTATTKPSENPAASPVGPAEAGRRMAAAGARPVDKGSSDAFDPSEAVDGAGGRALDDPAPDAFAVTTTPIPTPTAAAPQAAARAMTGGLPGPTLVVHDVGLGAVPIELGLKSAAGINRFEIRLAPAELGRIDVHLDIDQDGEVKARLVVDRADTLALLQRDARTLERAFEQAGLKPAEGGLDLSLRDNSGQGWAGHQGGRDARSDHQGPSELARSRDPWVEGRARPDPAPPPRRPDRAGVDLTI